MVAKITDIKVISMTADVPPEFQHVTDRGTVSKVSAVLVLVESSDGMVGVGESYGNGSAIRSVVESDLAPLLIGEDPDRVEYLWEKMYNRDRLASALSNSQPIPAVRRGVDIHAISGIDIALWDLKGKRHGVPVYELLGGKLRGRIKAFASGGWARPGGPCADEVTRYASAGFNAIKMRVGLLDDSLEQSVVRVEEARNALGSEVEIALEGHAALDYRTAQALGRMVEGFDIAWFDDPCSSDDKRTTARLRNDLRFRLAGGKNDQTRFDFREYIDLDALDIFTAGPAIAGGITELKRIADLAWTWNLKAVPHNWGSAVLFGATVQLAASSPSFYRFEFSQAHMPFLHELAVEPVEIDSDGYVSVSDRPGLGFRLRPDWESKFRS